MAAPDTSIELIPTDLAIGDAKSLSLDCSFFEIARIQSSGHPLFALAYEHLWAEFGAQDEMESREVIAQRLNWHPARKMGDRWLCYEMFLVQRQGQFVAVRDHTAVVDTRQRAPTAVLHLSHILVVPEWRRTGLAGWLRAWPIQTARSCLKAAGFPATCPIALVVEMEQPDPNFSKRMTRIMAYERAGFKKLDPSLVKYLQPDFRSGEEIDASGAPHPLSFNLLLRRIGREQEPFISGAEVRGLVDSLYRMYSAGCRDKDMAPLWQALDNYPKDDQAIPLIAPSG